MKNILTFICIVFASYIDLYAQQGGSNYSMFGIGDIRQSIGAGYDGLAGTQQAVQSYHAVNLANPAMWSAAKLTRLQIDFDLLKQQLISYHYHLLRILEN